MSARPPGGEGNVWRNWPRVPAREIIIVFVAAAVGVLAGAAVTAMSAITQRMHELLFALPEGTRLSASAALNSPFLVLVPAAGGLLMGLGTLALKRWRPHPVIDPIEANALHGGRMSLVDSIILALQTMVSNGFGASLGLEAGYGQIGGGLASRLGQLCRLGRNELRILVGAGAAAGLGAAFDAPLMGAFYGFELIIGAYAIPAAVPVLAATMSAVLTARALGVHHEPISLPPMAEADFAHVLPFVGLALVAAAAAVAIMLLVTATERVLGASRLPAPLRPALAGLAVGGLALYSPQVLSDGHGALSGQVASAVTVSVAVIFGLKVLASALSVGSGFRGGLFFASLFLGALLGKLYAGALNALVPDMALDPALSAVVGMGALAVGVISGPLTMSFLVLEMTGDLAVTGLVITAAAVTSLTVRVTFGFSFSTWRLHLRGESIRSPQDVGWIRDLTVSRMMRAQVSIFAEDDTIGAFRAAFPLGSTRVVALVDAAGGYAGLVRVSDAHAPGHAAAAPVRDLARLRDAVVSPQMNVRQAAAAFEAAGGAGELAVVDDPGTRRPIGLLVEVDLLRRYVRASERARRGLGAEE